METKPSAYFYGFRLTEEQGDRILGIKAELVAQHGAEEAAELYDGAREGFCTLLGDEYVHDFAGELFIGGFLSARADTARRKAIDDHLHKTCGRRLSKRQLSLFRVLLGESGEPGEVEEM